MMNSTGRRAFQRASGLLLRQRRRPVLLPRSLTSSAAQRHQSTAALLEDDLYENSDGPTGQLFVARGTSSNLVGQSAHISRTYGPTDNAQALLVTGGPSLAQHASFDPNHGRASQWIRRHAVGSASLSPILLHGLTGALVEAAFPVAVTVRQEQEIVTALIVGVTVRATVTVTDVKPAPPPHGVGEEGYLVTLASTVVQERDEGLIAVGEHVVWIHADSLNR